MAEAIFTIPVTGTINIEGDSVTVQIKESIIAVKIEGRAVEVPKRLQLERGRTLFDLVLEAAKAFIEETGENEFSAADLYHIAFQRYPDINLRRNSWGAHVVSSAPNHPSYRHYTAKRKYFRYLGKGKYSLDPSLTLKVTETEV
jgi:hypothetical protein